MIFGVGQREADDPQRDYAAKSVGAICREFGNIPECLEAVESIKAGNVEECVKFLRRELSNLGKVGQSLSLVASSVHAMLSCCYHNLQRFKDAEAHGMKALEIKIASFGCRKHPEVAKCLVNMADIYHGMHANAKAHAMYTEAISIHVHANDNSVDLKRARAHAAEFYFSVGNFKAALQEFEEVVKLAKQIDKIKVTSPAATESNMALTGDDVSDVELDVSSAYIRMGLICIEAQDFKRAIVYNKIALQSTSASQRSRIMECVDAIGYCLQCLDRTEEALEQRLKLRQLYEEMGKKSMQYYITLVHIGSCYVQTDQHDKAFDPLTQAIAGLNTFPSGSTKAHVLPKAFEKRAYLHCRQGNWRLALKDMKDALKTQVEYSGWDDQEAGLLAFRVANRYLDLGLHEPALEMLDRADAAMQDKWTPVQKDMKTSARFHALALRARTTGKDAHYSEALSFLRLHRKRLLSVYPRHHFFYYLIVLANEQAGLNRKSAELFVWTEVLSELMPFVMAYPCPRRNSSLPSPIALFAADVKNSTPEDDWEVSPHWLEDLGDVKVTSVELQDIHALYHHSTEQLSSILLPFLGHSLFASSRGKSDNSIESPDAEDSGKEVTAAASPTTIVPEGKQCTYGKGRWGWCYFSKNAIGLPDTSPNSPAFWSFQGSLDLIHRRLHEHQLLMSQARALGMRTSSKGSGSLLELDQTGSGENIAGAAQHTASLMGGNVDSGEHVSNVFCGLGIGADREATMADAELKRREGEVLLEQGRRREGVRTFSTVIDMIHASWEDENSGRSDDCSKALMASCLDGRARCRIAAGLQALAAAESDHKPQSAGQLGAAKRHFQAVQEDCVYARNADWASMLPADISRALCDTAASALDGLKRCNSIDAKEASGSGAPACANLKGSVPGAGGPSLSSISSDWLDDLLVGESTGVGNSGAKADRKKGKGGKGKGSSSMNSPSEPGANGGVVKKSSNSVREDPGCNSSSVFERAGVAHDAGLEGDGASAISQRKGTKGKTKSRAGLVGVGDAAATRSNLQGRGGCGTARCNETASSRQAAAEGDQAFKLTAETELDSDTNSECPICFEDLDTKTGVEGEGPVEARGRRRRAGVLPTKALLLRCGHAMCRPCLGGWVIASLRACGGTAALGGASVPTGERPGAAAAADGAAASYARGDSESRGQVPAGVWEDVVTCPMCRGAIARADVEGALGKRFWNCE